LESGVTDPRVHISNDLRVTAFSGGKIHDF
jgi:hypothetical protein